MRDRKKFYVSPRLSTFGPIESVTAAKESGPADALGATIGIDIACPSAFPECGI